MTVTRGNLVEALFNEVGLNRREAKELINQFFEEIREALGQGEIVKISGFGSFLLRDKASRPGRNPKTGENALIKARRTIVLRVSLKLKRKIALNYDELEKKHRQICG